MLFTDRSREDTKPKSERESSFAFMDRSARPEIARVRALLESALENYPIPEQAELVTRLKSDDETAFRSATFELLLHETLRRLGYVLTPHPVLENGSQKRPDFLVECPDATSFYLEAVLAGRKDGSDPAAEAMKATTLDLLRLAPHHSFLVEIDSEGDPTTQPSSRDLIRQVHEWLNSLDPDNLRTQMQDQGFESLPQFQWAHEGWTLTIRSIPLSPDRRGLANALIGAFGAEARWLDEWTPLRDAIKRKGSRYGQLDKPFVVAINSESFHLDPIDEMQALFGQEEYVHYVGQPELGGRMRRAANGAWNGPRGPQSRRVSAAWFFNDLTPYSIANRRSTLYVNPWAHMAAPVSMLQFPHARLVENRLVRAQGLSLREIFELTAGWPE